jgi:hypothetical protein
MIINMWENIHVIDFDLLINMDRTLVMHWKFIDTSTYSAPGSYICLSELR